MERDAPQLQPVELSPLSRVRGWLKDLFDFCYPEFCQACREPCSSGMRLCDSCLAAFDTLASTPYCRLCGGGVAYENAPCAHCMTRGVAHYDAIVRLGNFEAPIRGLVHQLKFEGRWSAGEILAERLFDRPPVRSLLSCADGLLAVPLHGLRELSRGYNQSDIIAARLSRVSGVPLIYPAVRSRQTEAQTHLHSRAKRMANLKGAFLLRDARAIAGKRIVVVDDVMTTGATLQVLGRALRKARPASLAALVVAVAQSRPIARSRPSQVALA